MQHDPADPPEADGSDDLIRTSDFESFRLEISITNMVSGLAYGSREGLALLGFTGTKSLLISAPARALRVGTVITLDARWAPSRQKKLRKVLAATAEVREVSPTEDDPSTEAVSVMLLQYIPEELAALESRFAGRQQEIEQYLAAHRS